MKTGTVIGLCAGVANVAGGAWVYASPYLALRSLQTAARAGDAAAFAEYVDFPAVRESFTIQSLRR